MAGHSKTIRLRHGGRPDHSRYNVKCWGDWIACPLPPADAMNDKKLLKAINNQTQPRTGCYYVVLFAVLGVLGIILLAVWVSWHVL